MELANGCLCCSVKSDFVAALEGLMLKRDKFDYILIETTGQHVTTHLQTLQYCNTARPTALHSGQPAMLKTMPCCSHVLRRALRGPI